MNAIFPEADDIGHSVIVHIRKLARIFVIAAPTSGRGTKFCKFEGRCRKMTVSDRERNVDASFAKADDIVHSVVVHIRKLARIFVIAAPTSGRGTKLRKLKGRCRKMTVSGRK